MLLCLLMFLLKPYLQNNVWLFRLRLEPSSSFYHKTIRIFGRHTSLFILIAICSPDISKLLIVVYMLHKFLIKLISLITNKWNFIFVLNLGTLSSHFVSADTQWHLLELSSLHSANHETSQCEDATHSMLFQVSDQLFNRIRPSSVVLKLICTPVQSEHMAFSRCTTE